MKRMTTLLCVSFLLLSGCSSISQSSYDDMVSANENLTAKVRNLQQENTQLKGTVNDLKKEIDEIKNGADRMLAGAKDSLTKGALGNAKNKLNALLKKHPGSKEAGIAKTLISQIEEKERKKIEAEQLEKKRKQAAEEKRLAQALSKMRKSVDEVKSITWYYDKTSPYYANENNFFLYIGKEANSSWLRLRIQYEAENWLFIEKYTLKVDDKTYTIYPNSDEIIRDNNTRIWEWADVSPSESDISMIRAIIKSKKTIIRHEGNTYYDDRTITKKEKAALQNVLDAYDALQKRK